jgi:large subunit ribosomal protein L29
MKASEMRGKTAEQLDELLIEKRREQFNLRMQRGTGQLARPSEMRQVRKDIARIKTVLNDQKAGNAS